MHAEKRREKFSSRKPDMPGHNRENWLRWFVFALNENFGIHNIFAILCVPFVQFSRGWWRWKVHLVSRGEYLGTFNSKTDYLGNFDGECMVTKKENEFK